MTTSFETLYEDAHLLAVLKPPHLATTSPNGKDCLAELVAKASSSKGRAPHPTSRLDTLVSGVVVFAKTDHAIRVLIEARKHGTYRRSYRGIAHTSSASPPNARGTWSEPIGLDPNHPKKRAIATTRTLERVQSAKTHFEIEKTAVDREWLWCRLLLHPISGRTHQLRVHTAHHGLALAGDVLYGGVRKRTTASGQVYEFNRVFLHCQEVRLPKLTKKEEEHMIVAPLPRDFLDAERALGLADS